jgi:hypothetical protein
MNLSAYPARSRAGAAAALVAAAGFVLAACGGSSSPGSSSAGSSTNSPSTSNSSAPASSTSSSSSGNSASTTSSLSVPFPIGVGNTWVYKTSVGLTGSSGTVTDKMTAVTPVSGGQQVTMTSVNDILGSHTTNSAIYIFHSDGSISYPVQQFGSSTTSVTGASVFWPPASEMASGQAYHSTLHIGITEAGKTEKVAAHITVQGDGSGSVTVPAGTYSATIVDMTMAFAVEGYQSSIVVKTWLANGVGPVQSEAFITELGASHLVSEQKLVSFTKG